MGSHDDYGKAILRQLGGNIVTDGPGVAINLGAGQPARIDGAIPGVLAIEVESRTSKQVRGAVLDLVLHNAPKKLLLLIPMYMAGPCRDQCENILGRFVSKENFRVIILKGTGENPSLDKDVSIVREALRELNI